MDLEKIIRELLQERKKLDQIVTSLEQLQTASQKGPVGEIKRGRRSMDAAARLEVSKRMKRYWASKKHGQNGKG